MRDVGLHFLVEAWWSRALEVERLVVNNLEVEFAGYGASNLRLALLVHVLLPVVHIVNRFILLKRFICVVDQEALQFDVEAFKDSLRLLLPLDFLFLLNLVFRHSASPVHPNVQCFLHLVLEHFLELDLMSE